MDPPLTSSPLRSDHLDRDHLPSPTAKTPSATPTPLHPFFTPRRPLSSIGTNTRSRTHLSPDSSPSRRKRPRLDSSPLAPRTRYNFPAEHTPEPLLPAPRQRTLPSTLTRLLSRELGRPTRLLGHCADWRLEVSNFYTPPTSLYTPSSHPPAIPFCTAASNTSTLAAVGDESGHVTFLDTAGDFTTPYLTLAAHNNAIFSLAFSADDQHLATSSGDQTSLVLDIPTQTPLYTLRGHHNSVKTISFNPQHPSLLASTSRDGHLHIYDLRTSGRREQHTTSLLPTHRIPAGATARDSITAAVWLSAQTLASTCQSDGVIRVHTLAAPYRRRRTPAPATLPPPAHRHHRKFGVCALALAPDARRLYALCRDNRVYAYAAGALEGRGPLHAYAHPRLHATTFYVKAGVARDGRALATGSGDGVVCVFPTDERYGGEAYVDAGRAEGGLRVGRGAALVRGHEKEVTDVCWTAQGELVSIGDDYRVRCWRRGGEAEEMREGGEEGGRRWGWGWAEVEGEETEGGRLSEEEVRMMDGVEQEEEPEEPTLPELRQE